jgi:hypothetical protein
MAYHQYFPQEWIDLQIELSYHPDAILAVMSAADYVVANPFEHRLDFTDFETAFLIKLAAIAAYCKVVVDGEYTRAQINNLCTILTNKLREQRKEWRVDHHE